jgi:hypothetical protein
MGGAQGWCAEAFGGACTFGCQVYGLVVYGRLFLVGLMAANVQAALRLALCEASGVSANEV